MKKILLLILIFLLLFNVKESTPDFLPAEKKCDFSTVEGKIILYTKKHKLWRWGNQNGYNFLQYGLETYICNSDLEYILLSTGGKIDLKKNHNLNEIYNTIINYLELKYIYISPNNHLFHSHLKNYNKFLIVVFNKKTIKKDIYKISHLGGLYSDYKILFTHDTLNINQGRFLSHIGHSKPHLGLISPGQIEIYRWARGEITHLKNFFEY